MDSQSLRNSFAAFLLALLGTAGIVAEVVAAPTIGVKINGIAAMNTDVQPQLSGAVGKNHVVQVVGTDIKICTKTGTCSSNNSLLYTFANSPHSRCLFPDFTGYGVVAYDYLADRFVIVLPTQVNGFQPGMCVAVSQTGDPTGLYNYFFFDTGWADGESASTPYLGVWPNGYYVTFTNTKDIYAFERDKMLQNDQSARFAKALLPWPDFVPSHVTGTSAPPTGAWNTTFAIYSDEHPDDGHSHTGKQIDGLAAVKVTANWGTNGSLSIGATLKMPFLAKPGQPAGTGNPKLPKFTLCPMYYSGSCVQQFGANPAVASPGTEDYKSLGGRYGFLEGPINYRNMGSYQSFLLTHNVDYNGDHLPGYDPANPNAPLAKGAVAWHEIRLNSSLVPFIYQSGTWAGTPHYFAGSMAMNKNGDIGMIYDASSPTVYESIRFTGRRAGDSINTMTQGEATAHVSGSTVPMVTPAAEWGPQSMSIDPDGCTFWGVGLYVLNETWASGAISSTLPNCMNWAKGRSVTVSSSNPLGSNPGSNAVDGNTGTYWQSTASDAQSIVVDLGKSRSVNQVVIRWGGTYASSYSVETQNSRGQWSSAYSTTSGSSGVQTVNFSSRSTRYVRVSMTKRSGLLPSTGYRLAEFEVYGE